MIGQNPKWQICILVIYQRNHLLCYHLLTHRSGTRVSSQLSGPAVEYSLRRARSASSHSSMENITGASLPSAPPGPSLIVTKPVNASRNSHGPMS